MRLGLDIGGTKIEAVVLDDQGETLYRQRYSTQKQSYEAFFHSVITAIDAARAATTHSLSIGLGLPGASATDGLLKNSNSLVLNQQPSLQQLEQHFNMPVSVTNYDHTFTLSEAIDG